MDGRCAYSCSVRRLNVVLVSVVGVLAVGAIGGGTFAWVHASRFDARMARIRDVPVPQVEAPDAPEAIERGRHVAHAIGGCATRDCHGSDLGGGAPLAMGPVATFVGPNVTRGGTIADYSDGELLRLLTHGVRKDGTSVPFMPVQEFAWLPDDDLLAVVAYLRSVPPIDRVTPASEIGVLGKVLDGTGKVVLDVASHMEAHPREVAPPPEPTAKYGAHLAKLCFGCHGQTLSGGPIPGAPSDLAVPTNLTPHATGLAGRTYADFERLLETGEKQDGTALDPFMPLEALRAMNDVERRALWAYLEQLPPREFGQR